VSRVGFNNFDAITRYNRSPMYAMAVHDLGEAVLNFMRDANR
jgi:membrane-bound lytic murein transglycosylase B